MMELFTVNRHVDGKETNKQTTEDSNLSRLLKKVEKRKKQRADKKKKTQEELKLRENTKLRRQKKREQKSALPSLPENVKTPKNVDAIDSKKNIIPKPAPAPKKKIAQQHGDINGFTILGGEKFQKVSKIKRVLPQWLSHPTVISVNLQNLDTKISQIKGLDKNLRKKLKANGIKYLFPVQAVVIPWLLKENKNANIVFPSDICVSAPTGSGKTLAFVLPIIQLLKGHLIKKIRALIILPTQDLATQVYKAFQEYCKGTTIDISLITGQCSFQNEQSQLVSVSDAFGYSSKVDILVSTAGRLVDHLKSTPGFDLSHLEFLVIDEADRVLDNVQNDWLYHLEKHLQSNENMGMTNVLNVNVLRKQRPPQKLLFSATLSQDPEKLQKLSLFQPKLFTSVVTVKTEKETGKTTAQARTAPENQTSSFIGKYTTPTELTEKYLVCSLETKPLVLFRLIQREKLTKTIIFTHSLESVHRLVILLGSMLKTYKIAEISSNWQIQQRNKIIDQFSNDQIDLLICTDAMARGMDLQGVKCVISYSSPRYLKTYIHRVGRTARAGELGLAITMLHQSQLTNFNSLLQQANKQNLEQITISEDDLQPHTELYQQALDSLRKTIEVQTETELKKLKSNKRPKKTTGKRKKSKTENTKESI